MGNLYEVYEVYEVYVLRGCGIKYSVYQGSMQECIDFIASEDAAKCEKYFNGNRQPFSWKIRAIY